MGSYRSRNADTVAGGGTGTGSFYSMCLNFGFDGWISGRRPVAHWASERVWATAKTGYDFALESLFAGVRRTSKHIPAHMKPPLCRVAVGSFVVHVYVK